MSYMRVIPRDLFNESNLLKCYGQLALLILDYKFASNPHFDEPDAQEPFVIEQDEDGALFIYNLPFYVNDRLYALRRPLNSRETYPLYLSSWDWEEPISVFTVEGKFTEEMRKLLENG